MFAVGRDFHGERHGILKKYGKQCTCSQPYGDFVSEKENIDAPLDSADDHAMHWTGHIGDIHDHRLYDTQILLHQHCGAGYRLAVRL